MTTNLLNNLSNHSAPFGTRWKPAGEKGSTRVWKHVAMIFAVLVMSMANIGMAWGANGDVLFTQAFGSGSLTYTQNVAYTKTTTLTNLVGNGSNLFTSLTTSNKNSTGIAINHATGGNSTNATGFFQAYFNNTSGYWSCIRTNDFAATAPTALKMTIDVWVNIISGTSNAAGVYFAIGNGFTDALKSSSAEDASKVHSGFGITAENSPTICQYNTPGTDIYATTLSKSTWLSITWIMNNTGDSLTYNNPTGSGTTKLANDKFDIWLKTQAGAASTYTKVVSAQSATTASIDLQELYIGSTGGKKMEFRMDNIVVTDLTPGASCTAPDHVNVTGRWDRFAGETINLTATAYDGSDAEIAAANITGYQWEKLIGSTWTALSNGTVDGVTTSGATTKNLQIANCGAGNSGKYRCVVSTGAACSTASATATDGSEGHGVKVYVLECYTGGTTEHHFTRTGDTQAGTLTMTLTANTAYTFKVHADNTYYGNNGTINKDEANWVMCNSDNGGDCANNLTVNSGLGGTFTFGIEYSTGGNSSVEGEPEISVTYPRKTIYLVPNSDWLSNSAKFAFYYYGTSGTGWTDFLTSNDCGMSAEIPQWNGLNVIAVRFNPSDATPGWNGDGHVWNQTGDIAATADKNCVTITDWNAGTYGTYSPTTYTISYAAGSTTATGGAAISGSKASESKTCGVDFTLPSSAVFTAAGYTQVGWTTSDGGSQTHALGGSYTTNAAQTFYPVWEAAASLTALECNTLYTPADMLPSGKTISNNWQYDAYGLSGNTKFFIVGNGGDQSTAEADAGIVEIKTGSAVTISGTGYSNYCYFKKAPQMSSTTPTSKAIKFILSGSGSLDVYGKGVLALVKEGGSPTTKDCTSTPSKVTWDNLTAGTYYLYATGTSRYMVAMQFNCCTTPAAPTAFSAGSITSTGATFSITDAADAASYDIYYSTSSTAPTAVTAATTTSTEKTKAVTGLTASTTYYAWVRSVCDADHKSAWVALTGSSFTTSAAPASALITYNLNVGTSASTTLKSSTSTTDGTNITNIDIDQTNDGANGAGQSDPDRTTKILIKTGANGADWSEDPTNYEIFKFKVACGKKMTPSKIRMKVANVGSASADNIKYKAVLSDTYGHSLSGTYVVATQDGTVETFDIDNADASKYFQGEVTLKLWAWTIANKSNGGSAFRMGTPVEIYGAIGNQATPAATITWNTQPANGQVGDPDFAYDVTCSDGSAVTVTSANTTYATIVGGKLHYASAGTTHLVASATDACGNVLTPVNSNDFTVTVPVTYSITYDCDGAESGCPSNVAAATNLPNPLPSAPTKDGYDFVGWYTNSTKTVAAVAGAALSENTTLYAKWTEHIASECITITNFETSQHSSSDNKPDSQGKYIYGYKTTVDAEHAVTITTSNTNNKGQNSNADMLIHYGSSIYIYADNTTTGGTPATFSNVVSISLKIKNKHATDKSNFTIKVGSTTVANAVSLVDANNTTYTTYTYNNLAQLSGKIEIHNGGSGSTNFNFYVDDIEICTADMAACTTPTLPTATLNDQNVCPGNDIAEWDATPTNVSTITGKGESVSYSWKKKGSETVLGTSATLDLGSTAAESQSGTYVVTVTVSKAGYTSVTVSKELDLSVTAAVEEPVITANKATVYPGNSVTLTATCGTAGVTWNWYKCTAADGSGAGSSLATTAAYTFTAPEVGTHYYKATASTSGTCASSASAVYTLTVTEASGGDCETEFWFAKAADKPEGATAATHISGTPSGSSSASYTATIDGNNYTITGQTGQKTGNVTITVPEDYEGTLYVVVQGSSSRTITLSKGGVQVGQETPENSTWGTFTFSNLDAGTYTLVSSGNIGWGILALKLCSAVACSDPEVTASADNTTACVGTSVTFTAANAHASATYQWQKLDGTWTNISGATASTYNIASVVAGDAGKYRVIASHDCNRTSNEVTLSVPSVPNFGSTVPVSVSVMQTIALSINTVEATDATKYRWYKSADATWDAGDAEIGDSKNLIKAYDGEAIGSPSYYIFCRAQNACGITTSTAIAVNVIAYVEEDCATRGNEGEAQFGFENTSMSSGTYDSKNVWYKNSNSAYLTYTAPTGKYFKTAKVTIASSNSSNASYQWSTDGSSWTAVTISGLTTTLTETEINLAAKGSGRVTHFRIGRNLDGAGESSGTFYLHKACFEYTEACTSTTVTPSTASVDYEMGDTWSNPTFSLSPAVGTLTYTSSNEDIASVDDDGTVTFNGDAGTVTITASYAGGTISATDYCASSGSYTINVSCPGGAPKVVADGSTDMSGCNSSVTLHAKTKDGTAFADGTYQWFRNGEEIDGATSSSYTATQAGIYTVERTNASGCTTPSTNSATVTSETTEPEVERLVPFQYYHVDKTYTDYMKMRHLFAVKNSGKLDGKSFKLYVSRNGGDPTDVTSSNALAIWPNDDGRVDTVMVDLNKLSGKYAKGDELVYTCKAIDCESHVSETYKNTIQMHVIDRDTATLALICSGASGDGTRDTKKLVVGGDFLTGYNKADLCVQTGNTSFDKTQEWVLYTRLKENYIVTPVNGYAPFYKLNYEPFDILFLTDYPKASKSDAAATILDDMADLCDYRPLFTFKTHMVHKTPSKWAAKGFMATPEVPKQSRLRLNIVCYAHPMFDDLKEVSDQIQKDASDHSQIVYTMLTGPGHESSKGMQGFPIDAAEGFVTIGLVHNDATAADDTPSDGYVTWTPGSSDVMLVAAAERQVNLEARMILFSVNCGAQSKLTETGRQVVLKSLEYLLSDATITPVADCSFTFTNGAGNSMTYEQYKAKCPACTGTIGDGKWSTAGNWAPDWILQPSKDTEVKIAAPVTVDMPRARVRTVRIVEGGRIEIPAGSGLEVTSTIRHMDGTELSPTEVNDLKIGASSTGNGTLIFNNNTGDTKAGVAMYSKAFITDFELETEAKNYQYIGSPYVSANAAHNYYDSWLYYWTGTKWKVVKNGGPMTPWTGYCITQVAAGTTYWMDGTLTETGTVDIAVGAGQDMVVGNSWTAPLYIKAFTDDDFENLLGNVYFFNTGIEKDHTMTGHEAATRYQGSTYVTVPIHAASYTGDSLISSLQGFFVTSSGSDGTLHLDYDRHVRPAKNRNILSGEMHAPKRRTAIDTNEPEVVKIKVSGENYDDRLVLLAREDFSAGFDNGWDGDKWDGNEASLYIYSKDERGVENSVSAIPEMEGTVVGFRAGEDEAYTFTFEYLNSDEPLYLFDTENNSYTQIVTGGIYRFFTNDKEKHERFVLTRHAPQIATGCENLDGGEGAKAKKLLIEDKMFIMVNGLLYDATGKVVK